MPRGGAISFASSKTQSCSPGGNAGRRTMATGRTPVSACSFPCAASSRTSCRLHPTAIPRITLGRVHDAALLASEADLPDRVFRRRVAVLTGREPGAHGSLGGQVALAFACEGPHVELGLETHRGGGCSRDGVEGAAFNRWESARCRRSALMAGGILTRARPRGRDEVGDLPYGGLIEEAASKTL